MCLCDKKLHVYEWVAIKFWEKTALKNHVCFYELRWKWLISVVKIENLFQYQSWNKLSVLVNRQVDLMKCVQNDEKKRKKRKDVIKNQDLLL